MAYPVLLAHTDVLFAAGVAHALREQRTFALRQPVLRSQAELESAMRETRDAIALVAEALLMDRAALAEIANESGCALVVVSATQHGAGGTEAPPWRGVLRRNADARQLLLCLRSVAAGGRWTGAPAEVARETPGSRVLAQLSPRQLRILSEVSRGAKNADIARELHTTEQVVKNMLSGIYDLTGVSDRLELALFVLHHPELAEAARAITAEGLERTNEGTAKPGV